MCIRDSIFPTLRLMEELAALLRERRFARGSVDFELEEAKIVLDRAGKPVKIGLRDRRTAEKLIDCLLYTSIAGDNTIFIAVSDPAVADTVASRLKQLAK